MVYFLTKLPIVFIINLIPLGLISIGYTIPITKQGKRLRDFDFIKVFLIAIVWAYIASVNIAIGHNTSLVIIVLLFLEKFLFVMSITLPFDVRDIDIDSQRNLTTIPHKIGVRNTYNTAYLLLSGGLITTFIIFVLLEINLLYLIAIMFSYSFTLFAIMVSKNKTSDYYFSGLLDGTFIVRGVLACGVLYYLGSS